MRRYLFMISLGLLLLMVFFYLIGKIDTSNQLGSIGFGLLIIIVISYLPELFRKGYISKF